VKVVAAAVAIVVALAIQTTLPGFKYDGGTAAIDLLLVLPIYIAVTAGAGSGVLAASLAGLLQDSLSSGILGIGALAKTIVAYLAGVASTQFILNGPLQRFFMFFLGTVAHAVIFMGLYTLLDLRTFPSPVPSVLTQALGNAVVGVIGFQIAEWLPGFLARRRATRPLRR
jgi:rod shape-determining protein MreD